MQYDAERILRVGETDTVGPTFMGADLAGGVTVSSATVAVSPGEATDVTGDTDGETGIITGMADTSDFEVGDPVTVSAGFATTGPFTITAITATSITVDELSDSVETNVTVTRAAGLVLGSGTALITDGDDGAYAWATAVRAGEYAVTFTVTFSDSKVLVKRIGVIVPDLTLETTALVSIAEVKQICGSIPWESETRLQAIIEDVSARFNGTVGCDLLPDDFEEELDGSGMSFLYLPHWPVTAVTSVTENDTVLTEGTDFYVNYDIGILHKYSGKWTTYPRAVEVEYSAGYETLPADVKMAALVEVKRIFEVWQKNMHGESSRTQEGEAISINTDELLPATLATLARYRRVRI